MRSEGYGSRVVCLSVCHSVTTLVATVIDHGPKVRYHKILYDDFLDFNSRISLRRLCSRDMVLSRRALKLSPARRQASSLHNTRNDRFER